MKPTIEQYAKNAPFIPFEIELVGGRVLRVDHPEFVYVPPGKGLYFVVTHRDGTPETCNAVLVVAVRPSRGRLQMRKKAG
jgi:hypothetical protein